eukprot:TRINITY_DN9802_c0_g1_i1.p1 TRINITY_DN9802_c0_g1~~TRINITY_DN9802_c0_g1_i1.p1  ORF type:complete len:287 (+),score=97.94 TRINITY_DN9802_c0_g1_i1:59-919(+)
MQHDDTIWSVISQGFCSFKAKLRDDVGHAGAKAEALCRNPYNITGLCNRVNCPLANSQYATVVENDNELYLYMKTVERAHTPKRLWEKVLLPRNFKKALELINDNLQWWDRKIVMKCKHRLLRLKQVLIRKRRLALRGVPKLVGIKKKEEKQLAKREAKAEKAARVEVHTKKMLLAQKQNSNAVDIPDEELIRILEEEEENTNAIPADLASIESLDSDDVELYTEDETSDEESEEQTSDQEDEEERPQTAKRKATETTRPIKKRRYIEIEEETEMQNRLSKSIMDL